MTNLSQALRFLREEKGVTQKNLADAINMTRLTVSNYEHGRREPDTATLCSIADYYGCSIDYLLGRRNERM